jgi:hypothetical protein
MEMRQIERGGVQEWGWSDAGRSRTEDRQDLQSPHRLEQPTRLSPLVRDLDTFQSSQATDEWAVEDSSTGYDTPSCTAREFEVGQIREERQEGSARFGQGGDVRSKVTVREGGEVQEGHVPPWSRVWVEAGIVPFGIAELDGGCKREERDG